MIFSCSSSGKSKWKLWILLTSVISGTISIYSLPICELNRLLFLPSLWRSKKKLLCLCFGSYFSYLLGPFKSFINLSRISIDLVKDLSFISVLYNSPRSSGERLDFIMFSNCKSYWDIFTSYWTSTSKFLSNKLISKSLLSLLLLFTFMNLKIK